MNTQLKGINTGEAALIEAYERTRQNNQLTGDREVTADNPHETTGLNILDETTGTEEELNLALKDALAQHRRDQKRRKETGLTRFDIEKY